MEQEPSAPEATVGEVVQDQTPQTTGKTNQARNRKLARFGIVFAILGLLLFAYFVRKAGVAQILAGIQRLGFGFLLILAISAVRQVARSLAWTRCFEPPYKLRFRDAFAARVMGDALGNIIPLASVAVSEPSKAAFVTHRVPLMASLAALALENIFYSLSVILLIFSGTAALLLSFSLPKPLRYASIGALAVTLVIAPLGYFVIRSRRKFLSGLISFIGRLGIARVWITEKGIPRAQTLEDRIYGFYDRHSKRLLVIFLLEICFHLAGIAEIYVTLLFISDLVAPTLLTAFILESVNRIINVAFKFMPFRLGVDEAGTGMLAKTLGFTAAIGATLAIVRKARDLFWTAVGVVLIIRRGLSLKNLEKAGETKAA
ncbi:MAG TPA: lysylphosphatidylglycerol synthase transmembrane domain-containing protein [Pyrinomonadaceae bacterium]|nr:lysylphosphatidylglycerol synthase transmembrane domain-containing protein [Pyrinomonadaceae bacterium]